MQGRAGGGGGSPPPPKIQLLLGIRSYISNAIWKPTLFKRDLVTTESVVTFQQRPGAFGNLHILGPTDTPPLDIRKYIADACWRGLPRPPGRNNPMCAFASVVPFQALRGTLRRQLAGSFTGRGQRERFPPYYTAAHCRRVLVRGGIPPSQVPFRLGIRKYISNATSRFSNTARYILTAIDGRRSRPGPKARLPALLRRGTLQMRVGGGGRPATKDSVRALVLAGAFQTRPRTFQTQPGTFGKR